MTYEKAFEINRMDQEYKEKYFLNNDDIDVARELVWNACLKADKYKWHDLRKNPEDLPKKDGEYYTFAPVYYLLTPDPESEMCKNTYCIDYFKNGKWENGFDGGKPIAWREIEPFESEVK